MAEVESSAAPCSTWKVRVVMLFANVPVGENVRNTAQRAFTGACEKRERLAQEIERLVYKGVRDPALLQRHAVENFKYCNLVRAL